VNRRKEWAIEPRNPRRVRYRPLLPSAAVRHGDGDDALRTHRDVELAGIEAEGGEDEEEKDRC